MHALVDIEGLPLRVIVHPPAYRIATVQRSSSTRSAGAFQGWNSFGPMRLQRPSGQGRRRQIAWAAARNRQAQG